MCGKRAFVHAQGHRPAFAHAQGHITRVIRAGLSKCGTRLEAFLRGPIQWRVQKFLWRVIKSQW